MVQCMLDPRLQHLTLWAESNQQARQVWRMAQVLGLSAGPNTLVSAFFSFLTQV